MTRLKWGDPTKRFFDTGLDRGVLFPKGTPPAGDIIATNLATNPQGKTLGNDVDTNYVVNPRSALTTNDTRTNLFKNPRALYVSAISEYDWLERYGWTRSWLTGQTTPIPGLTTAVRFTCPVGGGGTVTARGWDVAANVESAPGASGSYVNYPVTPGDTLTLSTYIRPSVSSTFFAKAGFHDGAGHWVGGTFAGTVTPCVANNWTRVSITVTVPAGAAYLGWGVRNSEATSFPDGTTFDGTAGMIEKFPQLLPYFDGGNSDSVWTYAWSGSANVSSSTRTGPVEIRRNLAFNPKSVSTGTTDESWEFYSWTRSWLTSESTPTGVTTAFRMTCPADQTGVITRGWGIYGNPYTTSPGTTTPWVRRQVVPNQTITFSTYIRSSVASSFSMRLRFHDGRGNWVGAVTEGTSVACAANTWTRISHKAVVPAGASYVSANVGNTVATTFTTGSTIDGTSLLIMASTDVYPYFDGSTASDTNGVSYKWLGITDNSESVAYSSKLSAWSSSYGVYPVKSSSLGSGSYGNDVYAIRSGYVQNGIDTSLPVTADGEYYAAKVDISRIPGGSARGAINFRITDGLQLLSDYLEVQLSTLPSNGSAVTIDVVSNLPTIAGRRIYLRIYTDSNNPEFRISKPNLSKVSGPGEAAPLYFDGGMSDNVWTYAWTGTADSSASTRTGPTKARTNLATGPDGSRLVSGVNDFGINGTFWHGIYSLETGSGIPNGPDTYVRKTLNQPNPVAGSDSAITLTQANPDGTSYNGNALKVKPNTTYFLSVFSRTNASHKRILKVRESNSQTSSMLTETSGNTFDSPAGEWVRLWIKFTTGPDTDLLSAIIYPGVSDGAYSSGDTIDATGVLLEESSNLGSYFSGSTPDSSDGLRHAWLGTADNSQSVAIADKAKNWWTEGAGAVVTSDPASGVNYRNGDDGTGMHLQMTVGNKLMVGHYYSARFRIRKIDGVTSNGTMTPHLWDGDSYIAASDTPIDLSTILDGVPTTVHVKATNAASLANYPDLVFTTNVGEDANFHIDEVMIDEVTGPGVLATSFFSGDTSDTEVYTYTWSGTANDSTSTKTENNSLAVPWDGLTSVDEDGADSAAAYYIDGRPFLFLPKPKEYKATLKAITYPDEFAAVMGLVEVADGMYLDSQMGDAFDLCYRTLVGNGVDGEEAGYKIHLIYNATVAPAGNTYQTLGGAINPVEFSWEIQAVPVPVTGYRPTAHIVIDTRHMDSTKLAAIEGMLYGDDTHLPSMRDPQVMLDLLSFGDTIVINDLGNGEWEAVGSYKNIYLIGDGVFEIDNVNAVDNGDGTYTVSSTP